MGYFMLSNFIETIVLIVASVIGFGIPGVILYSRERRRTNGR